jgi:ketosteroid isomerase-like protein
MTVSKRLAAASLVSALSLMAGLRATAAAPVDTAAIVKVIQSGEMKWGPEWEARNAEAIGSHFTVDGVFMPLDAPPLLGRAAIVAAMGKQPVDKDYTMVFLPESVDVAASGDLAISMGSFEQHRSIPMKVVKTGHYLMSYRKQPDGAWLVTAHSSTLDAPLGKGVSKLAVASGTTQAGPAKVGNPYLLTPDHPNALWIAEVYRGGAAIEADPSLDPQARERKMAEHMKTVFAKFSPHIVIHTGGVALAATGDEAFMKAYVDRRNVLSKNTFRAIETDQILANDSYGVLHGTFAVDRDGKTIEFTGMGVWRFENGLAVEHWEIADGQAWDDYFLAAVPGFKGTAEQFWLKK